MRTPQIPTLADATLIDKAFLEIQTSLVAKLDWLDHAFGKAQRLKKMTDGKVVIYPGVYVGQEEYLNVFPDEHIGNFTFFDMEDGEDLDHKGRGNINFTASFGLIVWFDYRKVYPNDWQQRTIENVKAEVIDALKRTLTRQSSITLTRTWERSENIYKGYTNKEVRQQFLMRPYGGFKIEGDITFKELTNC